MAANSNPDDKANPLQQLAHLPERGKEPTSTRILDGWVARAQSQIGIDASLLGWLIASTIVVAALQRDVDEVGRPRFLLKGGAYLQHRLNWSSRPTRDVDGLIRGDIEEFLANLDDILRLPWGPLTISRSEIEIIDAPLCVIKPRRFDVKLLLKGVVWRRIRVEIAADEGGAAAEHDDLLAPSLSHFGLPTPEQLVGIALRYQIAQKLHACSDPHDPPVEINDRARDVIDLLLLRDVMHAERFPTSLELRQACVAVFIARAEDAEKLGRTPRFWPCVVFRHTHWEDEFRRSAEAVNVRLSLTEAVAAINDWVLEIDSSSTSAS